MIRSISDRYEYKKVMAILSALTFIAGIGVGAFGELLLPIASAITAALFIFESPKTRFLSYLIPSLSIAANCILFGLYSLISIQFVLVALILALCYRFGLRKAETSVYLTLAIFVLMLVGLYVSAAKEIGSFSLSGVSEYYNELVAKLRDSIYELLTSENSSVTVSSGIGSIADDATIKEYVNSLTDFLPSVFAILAFALTGFTVKLFVFIMLKISKHGILKGFAHFIPSSLISYVYVVISIIAMFINDTSVFSLAIVNTSQLLMFVFAYVGLQYVLALGAVSGRRSLIFTLAIAAFILAPQGAIQILSYLGAWFSISFGKGAAGAK